MRRALVLAGVVVALAGGIWWEANDDLPAPIEDDWNICRSLVDVDHLAGSAESSPEAALAAYVDDAEAYDEERPRSDLVVYANGPDKPVPRTSYRARSVTVQRTDEGTWVVVEDERYGPC